MANCLPATGLLYAQGTGASTCSGHLVLSAVCLAVTDVIGVCAGQAGTQGEARGRKWGCLGGLAPVVLSRALILAAGADAVCGPCVFPSAPFGLHRPRVVSSWYCSVPAVEN